MRKSILVLYAFLSPYSNYCILSLFIIQEDMGWRSRLTDGGGDGALQDFLTPGERVGPLWDVYRHLVGVGGVSFSVSID